MLVVEWRCAMTAKVHIPESCVAVGESGSAVGHPVPGPLPIRNPASAARNYDWRVPQSRPAFVGLERGCCGDTRSSARETEGSSLSGRADRQAAARRAASSASAPSLRPPRTTSRGTPSSCWKPLKMIAPASSVRARCASSPKVSDTSLGGRVGEHLDRLLELVGAELRALQPLEGAGAATDGERCLDRRRRERRDVAVDLRARQQDGFASGRIVARGDGSSAAASPGRSTA